MEQTQEQLDAMPMEELEQLVSQEGVLAAPSAQGESPAQATAQPSTGEAVGQPQTQEAPKEEAPPKYFQDYVSNMKRELGSLRSLASLKDQLPQLVQKQLQAEMAKLQQAQRNANLSPEDQEVQAQLQSQQESLSKMIREQARAEFGEAGKEYIELLNELKEQRQDYSHRTSSLELVKDVIPEGADKAWDSLFEQVAKDIEAGKPGAVERMDRLEKDPAFVALSMIQAQRSQVQTQAQQVTQQRSNSARQAAQSVKPGGMAPSGKKNVAEMSQAELDAMPLAELEAAIPEQAR